MKEQKCENCGNLFIPSRGPSKGRSQRYCSKKCYGETRVGSGNSQYKGGSFSHGYRVTSFGGIRKYDHRIIMEKHIGRELLSSEVVHHKDRNPLNNSIDNLELLTSQSVHAAKHYDGFRDKTHKQCSKCLQVKSRDQFDAGRKKLGIDPQHSQCKTCRAIYYADRWKRGLTSLQKKAT